MTQRPIHPPHARQLRRQAGMTLIEIMIVLAILALIMGALVGPNILAGWKKARLRVASMTVRQYVGAYARWSVDHEAPCPDRLEELSPYVENKEPDDPWGHRLSMKCGAGAGPGEISFAVISAGPDGKENTDDDIHSWD